MSVCVSPLVQVTNLMTDDSLTCPQCPKSFSSTKLLQQHQQMFHTDKAFICETCGKAFRFRSNLAEHRSVHTALKPYVCKFCGKSSRLKGNLTKHILKHHKKEQNEAIGKDDIIVKKAPKTIKENGTAATTNGTTTSTTATATAVIAATTPAIVITNNQSNNNNSNNVANNNHRTIKMEIEDPDYISTKTSPTPVIAKVITSTPVSRPKTMPKELVTTVTPTVIAAASSPDEDYEDGEFLPRDISTELDRSVLISLGFDYGSTLSLTRAQLQQAARELKAEMSASPDTVLSDSDPDYVADSPPLQTNNNSSTVGGEATLHAMLVAATSGRRSDGTPDSTETQMGDSSPRELSPNGVSDNELSPSPPNLTQCTECGKHVRKSSHLPIHMTLSHGYPPPSAAVSVEKLSEELASDEHLQHELRTIANAISELKAQQISTPRVEQALTYIDDRVGRLEKSLETALNSIYTLVQLQTGMTSSVNRLREDSQRNFAELKLRIEQVSMAQERYRSSRFPRRRANSVGSCSRERSRSPL